MGTTHFSGPLISDALSGAIASSPVTGTVFYVDPASGSDSRDGLSRPQAKKTMQAAVDLCTADQGDVIVRMPGTEVVTTPVNFDCRGVTVISSSMGMPNESRGERFVTYHASSYAAYITDPTLFIGVGFATGGSTENALVDCQEAGGYNGGFNGFYYCRFPQWGTADHAIRYIGGSVNVIDHCTFDGLFTGWGVGAIALNNDTGGITPAYIEVTANRFHATGSGSHAIVHLAGSTPLSVLYAHNYLLPGFGAAAANLGKFIDNNSVSATGMIADNWIMLDDEASAMENMVAGLIRVNNHYDDN